MDFDEIVESLDLGRSSGSGSGHGAFGVLEWGLSLFEGASEGFRYGWGFEINCGRRVGFS